MLSFYASGHPDGLTHVAQSLGFADTARSSATSGSPLAGYAVSGRGATPGCPAGSPGLVGVAVVGLLMAGLVLLLRRRSPRSED